jgi:hypothetical protein
MMSLQLSISPHKAEEGRRRTTTNPMIEKVGDNKRNPEP